MTEAEIREAIAAELETARDELAWTGDPAGFWVGGMNSAIAIVRGEES